MAKKPKAAPVDIETCASCRFFLMDDPKDGAGFCRRYPKKYVGDEETGGWTQSVQLPEDWCGEYKRQTN